MADRFTRREVNRALPAGALALAVAPVLATRASAATTLPDFATAGGWYHGLRPGHIPRDASQPIARLLAPGARIDAIVSGRLGVRRTDDTPDGLAFTGFTDGDPRTRLIHRGRLA